MKVTVRLFASYREKARRAELEMELPDGATVGQLAREVLLRHPAIGHDPSRLVVAVNQEYQNHAFELNEGDEVALIPPVSGGSW